MTRITRGTFIESAAAAAGTRLVASAVWPLESPLVAAGPIPTRPFGKTGVQVSIAGLGGGGRFFEPVPTDEAGAELVRQAIDRGITFIETCANYGPDVDGNRSERRIGLAMKTHRAKAFLETKTDQRDYDGAMREMERSLKLLATDRIDLMLHHNLTSAKEMGIRVDRVKTLTFMLMGFSAGLVGGHCIGVDPYYMSYKGTTVGHHPQVFLGGRRINDGMGKFVAEKAVKLMTRSAQNAKKNNVAKDRFAQLG